MEKPVALRPILLPQTQSTGIDDMAEKPWWTWLFGGMALAMSVFVTGVNPNGPTLNQFAFRYADLTNDQSWHLLSSIFAHSSLFHLASNLVALLVLGTGIERAIGHGWFVTVFLGAGILGGLTHAVASPEIGVVGASGAIYGLMGAILILDPKAPLPIAFVQVPAVLGTGLYIALLPLLASWLPGVSHAGHLGGLAAGIICAFGINFALSMRFAPGIAISTVSIPWLLSAAMTFDWAGEGHPYSLLPPLAVLVIGLLLVGRAYYQSPLISCSHCQAEFRALLRGYKPQEVQCPACTATLGIRSRQSWMSRIWDRFEEWTDWT